MTFKSVIFKEKVITLIIKVATVKDITGVVTHLYNSANFVIQDINPDDDNTTSEAIMVNKASNGLKVGDLVTVAGTVEEWYYEGYSDMKANDLPITRIRATQQSQMELMNFQHH